MSERGHYSFQEPGKRTPLEKEGFYKIELEPEAANRLKIETVTGNTSEIPFRALFYKETGNTYIYINQEELTYNRESVKVDRIEDQTVYLSENINPEWNIVVTGVMELYGFETGFGGAY